MTTIVTRAGKGSALTWTEGDSNFTNLNTDKMESFTAAGDSGTSQIISGSNTLTIAGGTNLNSVASATDTITVNLDTTVTGLTSLTSATLVTDAINGSTANSPIVIAPDGTGDVHLNTDSVRIGDNNSNATLATRGTGDLILTTNEGSGTEGIIRIYDGANGNITITPNGTGNLVLDGLNWPQSDGTNGQSLITNGAGQLSWSTVSGGGGLANVVEDLSPQLGGDLDVLTRIITTSTTNGNITITANGSGVVYLNCDTVYVGDTGSTAYISSQGAANLILVTNAGTNSGDITINNGVNGNIAFTPNGTGKTLSTNLAYNEAVYTAGTTTGTITPNAANGPVQSITLTGSITFNAFTTPISGQTITLIITQPAAGGPYTLTSTMKFAGASKTLTTTANSIDILTVSYIGTTYYASLAKGFA